MSSDTVHDRLGSLFRQDYGRLVSHLTRILGTDHLPLVEESLQEAFARASVNWPQRGIPERPTGWLLAVARNHALDALRRSSTFSKNLPAVTHLVEGQQQDSVHADLEPQVFRDDQLRMMVSCCHPALKADAQVAILLKILGGLSVTELAKAFVCSVAAIEKRISRGKAALVEAPTLLELQPHQVQPRLPTVCQALYLMFNEGYLSAGARGIRPELCFEAMRLATLLTGNAVSDGPMPRALLAMFCFHSARLPANRDDAGNLILLMDQDRTLWDRELIAQGFEFLQTSNPETELSSFHLEALLAAKHLLANGPDDTDWTGLQQLYTKLYELKPSPVVFVNLAVVAGRLEGPDAALTLLDEPTHLQGYSYFHATRGAFLAEAGRADAARLAFERALELTHNPAEQDCIRRKLART